MFILRNYHGRALNEIDLPRSLSLNGLIALLSTVDRVTLIVPVGSAMIQVWLWLSDARRACKLLGRTVAEFKHRGLRVCHVALRTSLRYPSR